MAEVRKIMYHLSLSTKSKDDPEVKQRNYKKETILRKIAKSRQQKPDSDTIIREQFYPEIQVGNRVMEYK